MVLHVQNVVTLRAVINLVIDLIVTVAITLKAPRQTPCFIRLNLVCKRHSALCLKGVLVSRVFPAFKWESDLISVKVPLGISCRKLESQ